MRKILRKTSGTFAKGCGIIVIDENYNVYHLLVVTDRETKKPCVELRNEVYFEEDIK